MIKIPARLGRKLREDARWSSVIRELCETASAVMERQPVFFPDYTFHEISHINGVLDNADRLIPDDTFERLTPRDMAFLVAAVIIHDIGLLLNADGVKKLVFDAPRSNIHHDGKSWSAIWLKYIDEINRYSWEEMYTYFREPISVREDCIEGEMLTDSTRRIIGEFLRRYHHRIAAKVAFDALPGSEDVDLFGNTGLSDDDRCLIGLLAWSHGVAIRDTVDHVAMWFGRGNKLYNTPLYYLMSVLRMAEYLDVSGQQNPVWEPSIIQPGRLDEQRWRSHIDSSMQAWELDKRSLYINAWPESSTEYMHVDQWLKDVQSELDRCWLFLSELYVLDKYELSIRHIRSNIQDESVQKSMSEHFYFAKEVRLAVAPSFLSMVLPVLYENNPSYAVRELVQNAVDACIEREYAEKMYYNSDYRGNIRVELNSGERTLTITDNGIGMNEDVLTNYLLTAGASYRTSDRWKRDNTVDQQTQLLRSGRFGIGFLSVFLLGDSVSVETRNMYDIKGFSFKFRNTSRPLNILRTERETVGTTITVHLYEKVCKALVEGTNPSWHQWYAFDDPRVSYECDGVELPCAAFCSRNPRKDAGWFSLESQIFSPYQWKPVENPGETPRFYCNGFRIYGGVETNLAHYGLNIPAPHISLVEAEGVLEVNMSRIRLDVIPEKEALLRDVFCYWIAGLLLTSWETEEDFHRNLSGGFPVGTGSSAYCMPFLLSPEGFTLNYISVLAAMEIEQYVILYSNGEEPGRMVENVYGFLREDCPVSVVLRNPSSPAAADFAEALLSGNSPLFSAGVSSHGYVRYLTHIWMQDGTFRSIRTDLFPYLSRDARNSADGISALDWLDGPVAISPDMPIDREKFDPSEFPVAVQLDVTNEDYYSERYSDPNLLFPSMLRELLTPAEEYGQKDMWIPYKMDERIRKFPAAFQKLGNYGIAYRWNQKKRFDSCK